MKLFIEKEKKTIDLKFDGTVQELMKRLKMNSETTLIAVNDVFVDLGENISDGDSVALYSVVSGG